MLLAIDIGNTNIVLGVFDGEELVRSWRVKSDARNTADELALTFRGLLGDYKITGISACSTVPAVLRELRVMLADYFADVPTLIVEPGVRTGVSLQYENPKEVGADRIVNTAAAYHLVHSAAIVVDFGTSTNFDVVSARGEFLGGALAPGIEISLDALAARAAQLRTVELVAPRSPIGKSTVEALQSGILYGFAGQIDGHGAPHPPAPRPRQSRVRGGDRHGWPGPARHRSLRDRDALRARSHAAGPAARLRTQPVAVRLSAAPSGHRR